MVRSGTAARGVPTGRCKIGSGEVMFKGLVDGVQATQALRDLCALFAVAERRGGATRIFCW